MKLQPPQLEFSFLSVNTVEILIACSQKGLAAVMLGDNQHSLTHALQARFPLAHTRLVADGLRTEKITIKAILHGEETAEALTLDIQGTAFQISVWHALMDIPFASTITYQQLAETVGRPSATRAVASACGANSLAIIVPCHRVIRKNGDLGGYRWGLDIKQDLLTLEKQHKPTVPTAAISSRP